MQTDVGTAWLDEGAILLVGMGCYPPLWQDEAYTACNGNNGSRMTAIHMPNSLASLDDLDNEILALRAEVKEQKEVIDELRALLGRGDGSIPGAIDDLVVGARPTNDLAVESVASSVCPSGKGAGDDSSFNAGTSALQSAGAAPPASPLLDVPRNPQGATQGAPPTMELDGARSNDDAPSWSPPSPGDLPREPRADEDLQRAGALHTT